MISEGYHCNYGIAEAFAAELESGDLRVTGWDDNGDIRAVELVTHPFYVATLFQHERGALAVVMAIFGRYAGRNKEISA